VSGDVNDVLATCPKWAYA